MEGELPQNWGSRPYGWSGGLGGGYPRGSGTEQRDKGPPRAIARPTRVEAYQLSLSVLATGRTGGLSWHQLHWKHALALQANCLTSFRPILILILIQTSSETEFRNTSRGILLARLHRKRSPCPGSMIACTACLLQIVPQRPGAKFRCVVAAYS